MEISFDKDFLKYKKNIKRLLHVFLTEKFTRIENIK